MRSLVLVFVGLMTAVSGYGQATGDYRSAVVTGNWNTNTTWETYNGTSWVAATFAPAVGDGVITVRSGHTVTMTSGELIDQVVVAGILKINANVNLAFSNVNADVLTINSTGTVDLVGSNSVITLATNARIRSSGILIGRQGSSLSGATATNCFFEAGSTYQHLYTSTAGTIPLATWDATATLLIQGNVATGTAPTNLTQSFGNVTYNVSNGSPTLLLAGSFTNIQGSFSTLSTHARPIIFAGTAGYNLTVNGDFNLAGSGATTFNAATSGTSTLTIVGSYTQSLGTFTIAQSASNVNILVGKNFTRTNGSIVKSGSGTGTITFNQTLPQFLPQVFTVTGAGTPFSAVNFVVESGSTLDMGSSAVTGTGSFTLNSNATLIVGSTDASGAISASGGNIRVTGTKTFASGSTVTYHNAANSPQFMAGDHPGGAGVTTVINNTGGVTLVAGIYTLDGSLVLTNGNFDISGRDLTLGGTLTPGANFLAGDVTTILRISDAGTMADFNNLRVLGTSVIGTLALEGTTGRTVRLGADITVANELRLEKGDLQTNGYVLDIGGGISQIAGSLTVNSSSTLSISDLSPNPLPADLIISGGALGTLTMNRVASEFITSSNLTVGTVNLVAGTLTHTGTITMVANGKINVASGILTNPVAATTVYDVEYNGTVEADTGAELPISGTTLRHLIVSNPSQVNLKAPGAVVNGDLILTAGNFFADTTDITLRGNFQSDATSDFIAGTTFFDGTTVITGSVAPQFGNVTINSSRSLALSSTTTINVAGNIADNGTFTPNQSTVSLNGETANQFLSGSSTTDFYGLEINKPAFGVTVQHSVRVLDVVRILTATQLTAGNNLLTLVSNASRTARVNPLVVGAAINGSVIVQRYLPTGIPQRQYRYLSSPVTNTFVEDWKQEFDITGPFSDPSGGNVKPSMFWYDETFTAGGPGLNDRYRNYPASGTAAAAPLVHGRGYAVYPFVSVPITFDSRGTLGQQQVVTNVTAQSPGGVDGWNLIGNPYPSPILWSKITKSAEVDDAVYVPDNTQLNGGGFLTYINGVGVPANYQGRLDMAQGFWVHANANGTVTFDESDKIISTDSTAQIYRVAPRADVFRIALTSGSVKDEIAISFHPDATDEFDKSFDALKLKGPAFNLSSVSTDNRELTVNTMAGMRCAREVALSITEATVGNYTFTASGFETFGSDVNFFLVDKKTSSVTDLRISNSYSFTITAGEINTLSSRFVVQTDRTRVLTDLGVEGTSICFSDLNTDVTVLNSQPEVEYQAFYGASPASTVLRGNGAVLSLPVVAKSLNTGDNTFSIVATNGCITHTLTSTAVVNKAQQTATPSVTDVLVCSSSAAVLTASGALQGQTYNWYDTEDSSAPIANTANGSFEVSGLTSSRSFYAAITNSIGCESDRVQVNVKVVTYDSLTIDVDGAVLASNYESGNQWYFDGTLLPGETSPSLVATKMGTYTVKVDINGCIAEHSAVPDEVDDPFAELNVYPNPVTDKVNINFPANVAGPSSVSIVSSSGQIVYSEEFSLGRTITIKTADLSAGIYIVRIVVGDTVISRRILKI